MRRLLALLLLCYVRLFAETREGLSKDELHLANGEIAKGHFVAKDGDFVIFDSEGFGRLRVRADSATVVTAADKTSQAQAPTAKPAPTGTEKPAEGTGAKNTAKKPTWIAANFPNWHGSIDLALELRRENNLKTNFYTKGHITRDRPKDFLQLEGSWEYGMENKNTTVDVTKGNAYWRHNLTSKYFAIYAPTLEWNRSYVYQSVPLEYLLTRQQIGIGRTLRKRKNYTIRAGIAENYFRGWLWPSAKNMKGHAFVESAFFESDVTLPMGLHVVERGNYYYDRTSDERGWEHDLELNKRLDSNLRVGLRNEARQNVPGVPTSNYNLWRIFLGLEF